MVSVAQAASPTYLVVTLTTPAPNMPVNQTCSFSGLTSYAALNGQTLTWQGYSDFTVTTLNLSQFQIAFAFAGSVYPNTSDTGTMVALAGTDGTTGAQQPAWPSTWGAVTNDGGQNGGVNWTCFGSPIQNWGVAAVPAASAAYTGTYPAVSPTPFVSYWRPYLAIQPGGLAAIRDPSGSIQLAQNTGSSILTAGVKLPKWGTVIGGQTLDGNLQWINYGQAAPWYAGSTYGGTTSGSPNPCVVLDSNGNLQATLQLKSPRVTGSNAPNWATQPGQETDDGGPMVVGGGLNQFSYANNIATIQTNQPHGLSIGETVQITLGPQGGPEIHDVLLIVSPTVFTCGTYTPGVINGQTGGAVYLPGGAVTWLCLGPGSVLWQGQYSYAWSPHCVDGTVGTATPASLVANGGLGPSGGFQLSLQLDITGTAAQTDLQCDQLWLWRTAQGENTLILLDIIPNPLLLGKTSTNYQDVFDDIELDPEIIAPITESAEPPPANMTAPVYHLNRIWAIVDNAVVYSGGPDTITGNGNTAFPPLNEIPYPAQPIRLMPVTVQNGGLLVFTTDGIWIILGTGTPNNPFYTTIYYASVSLAGYNALDVYNTAVFLMENNSKVSTIAIEYPFNPQGGYTEIGFPIGDQFLKVTTGSPRQSPASSPSGFRTTTLKVHTSAGISKTRPRRECTSQTERRDGFA